MSGGPHPRTLVIGVGNEDRGDDAVGLLVARRVQQAARPHIEVVECQGSTATLLDAWSADDHVVLVDAVEGSQPGRCHRLDADRAASMRGAYSSHGLGAGEAIALASALGSMPASLVVYAVEGSRFGRGAPVAAAVAAAVEPLARRIVAEAW